jgi:hypothetical protein
MTKKIEGEKPRKTKALQGAFSARGSRLREPQQYIDKLVTFIFSLLWRSTVISTKTVDKRNQPSIATKKT